MSSRALDQGAAVAAFRISWATVCVGRAPFLSHACSFSVLRFIRVGFRVETVDGRALGEVAETFATGLNDVWVVRGTGREYLIPVIADVVRGIDRDARRILIDPLPGLLDT